MKKWIIAITAALVVSIYSPSVVQSIGETLIRVRDSVSQDFVEGANVQLFLHNVLVYNRDTDMAGAVVLDGMFNSTFPQLNMVNLEYRISRDNYETRWGAQTFYKGRTEIIDITPEIYCGDGVCSDTEDLLNCAIDCSICGDDTCSKPPENPTNCPVDCLAQPSCSYIEMKKGLCGSSGTLD